MRLYGREFTKDELSQRVGDISQVAGIKPYRLKEGRARDVEALDIKTGSGLNFTVLPGRAMDIAWMEHNGRAVGHMAKGGIAHPQYYQPQGFEWLRSFYGGVLATCGLTQVGPPEKEGIWELGLHGRISNTAATQVSHKTYWENDNLVMTVEGIMQEAVIFSENLLMTRKITAFGGESRLMIEDTIENQGYEDAPLMILYHMNFGFPVVSEDSRLVGPVVHTNPRDNEAQKGMKEWDRFQKPTSGFTEQVFFHDVAGNKDGDTCVGIVNDAMHYGINIKYNKNQLPFLTEWKMMGQQDYVVGLEPGNCIPIGRKAARDSRNLEMLKPGQQKKVTLELEILTNEEEVQRYKEFVSNLL